MSGTVAHHCRPPSSYQNAQVSTHWLYPFGGLEAQAWAGIRARLGAPASPEHLRAASQDLQSPSVLAPSPHCGFHILLTNTWTLEGSTSPAESSSCTLGWQRASAL